MKKVVIMFLVCAMMMCQAINVFANDDLEQYEMVECELETVPMQNESDVAPVTVYLANIYTSIVKVSSSQVSIRADAVCGEKVKKLTVIYILQKWNGSKWVIIASKSVTTYDVSSAHKSYTISGLGTGRYRCKASAMATGYSGYSETLAGYSASIIL